MPDENGVFKIGKWCKTLAAIVIALGTIGGSTLAMKAWVATADDLDALEMNVVKTLKQFREELDQKDLQRQYLFLQEQYYRTRDMLRKYPNDRDLQDDYRRIQEDLKDVKRKMQKSG